MHGRFLSRSAAVDPHVMGAVIGIGICGADAGEDEPTCAAGAGLIVDGIATATGAVTNPVTISPVGHVGHLAGQSARETFVGARFTGSELLGTEFSRAFRGE